MSEDRDQIDLMMEKPTKEPHLGDLVRMGAEATKNGAPAGYAKKVSESESIAMARVIAVMCKHFGLSPTVVLRKDGRATESGATYPYFLTDGELSGEKPIVAARSS